MAGQYRSWGGYPLREQRATPFTAALPEEAMSCLAFGNGRSYGDVCLNSDGVLVDMRRQDRFLAFDVERGVLRCQPGVLLQDILQVALPRGWFLPVTPGTQLATIGGAVANDVHGKNHHQAGTIGCHLLSIELLRSDGQLLLCSPGTNAEFFAATIGGLGLTGMIVSVELQLKPVANAAVDVENIKFANLTEFFTLSEASADDEYTVAWIDCMASGAALGRGHFSRGNHSRALNPCVQAPQRRLAVPLTPPLSLINRWSLKAFNWLYYHRQRPKMVRSCQHYEPFFYPLDKIGHWNRIYGRPGFSQFQCVVPSADSPEAIADLLRLIARRQTGSFLAVLKVFGDKASPGMLSFPRPGATLALDFPYRGAETQRLFADMESVVMAAGGAIYPAKDAHMSPNAFRQGFPQWEAFEALRDPALSSDFWRRVSR